MSELAVILGAGVPDGLGAALARRFARGGLHTIVTGRTLEKVETVATAIEEAGGSAEAAAVDVTDEDGINAFFAGLDGRGALRAVLYNAGNNAIIPFEALTAEQFEQFWRVGCFGGFLAAKAAMPILARQGEGTLIFTGASGSMRGRPNFAHFAAAKAGLRMLAQALAREYGPQGVHVAHVVVDGVINGDRVRAFAADYLNQLGENGALKPDDMAEAYWMLHSQPRSAWTHELDLRPFKESW